MDQTDLTRRKFAQLTAAAFGGVVSGALPGCARPTSTEPPADSPPTAAGDSVPGEAEIQDVSLLLDEPHVCRGLNACKGLGASKDNECAGQGTCATAEPHDCAGQNACKGQGGCGGKHGENDCKGKGGCHVPLAHGWDAVRAKFEEAMKAAGKTVGPAPAP